MAHSTCNNYLKRYADVTALKAGIQRHAFSNGVQINLGENISDIARFRQAIPKQKRPIAKNILEAPPPKRARIADIRIATATVINDLQAAVVDVPPAIVVVDAPPAIALNNDSPVSVAVAALPAIVVNGARKPLVLNGITIEVDPQTLMVNATQMCRAAGKLFGHYRRLDSTEEFLQELISVIHIRITGLIYTIQGGRPELQGTWVDWRVALHLAQWLSPAVQVQVTGWIGELRIENDQLLTQIEELQAAVVAAPPAIAVNGARKPLVLNGITIEVDPNTFMVNATQMCRAAGKRWILYYDNDKTKSYVQYI